MHDAGDDSDSGAECANADCSPQPFSVDKVNACDDTKKCDKLYVDDKAFLVNVLIGVRRPLAPAPSTD